MLPNMPKNYFTAIRGTKKLVEKLLLSMMELVSLNLPLNSRIGSSKSKANFSVPILITVTSKIKYLFVTEVESEV